MATFADMKKPTMARMAEEAARELKPFGASADWENTFSAAYLRGVEDLARLVGQFVAAVRKEVDSTGNEYYRGQKDGVKWAAETVENLIRN